MDTVTREMGESLRQVRDAIRLSGHILRREPEQLRSQLWGRLAGDLPGSQRLLKGALDTAKRPWLRSLTPRLAAPGGSLLHTLQGHTDGVTCVVALPDGRLVSGLSDGTLRIWDPQRCQTNLILRGHSGWVAGVGVLPDGRVVSGSRDNTLRVWDPETGETLCTMRGHEYLVTGVAVLPDGRVVSGSYDKTLCIWDPESGEPTRILEGHSRWVSSVAVQPPGRVVSSSVDGSLRVWDPDGGEGLALIDREAWGRAISVAADGMIVVGDRLGRFHFLRLEGVASTSEGYRGTYGYRR